MAIAELVTILASCLVLQTPLQPCLNRLETPLDYAIVSTPKRTGESVDVDITAESALAWDLETGEILYHKNEFVQRPIASLSKLATVLVIRNQLAPTISVIIPPEIQRTQREGADIRLPAGEHASVQDLLNATLIASANDAAVTLAMNAYETEDQFSHFANDFLIQQGILNTRVANATGLTGGEQYSTAADVKKLLELVFSDPVLAPMLSKSKETLITREGSRREYKTTNDLINSYMPIIAAKTGYTVEAGENLAIITQGKEKQKIGVIVLGSQDRFRDMKVLVEWIWRNYSW